MKYDWDLQIQDPVLPIHEPGSSIGILDVILTFEYREEIPAKFYILHEDESFTLARVSIAELKCFMSPPERTPTPPREQLPPQKLPDNAQHPHLHTGVCNPVEDAEEEGGRWGWIKNGGSAASRAKQGLALFW